MNIQLPMVFCRECGQFMQWTGVSYPTIPTVANLEFMCDNRHITIVPMQIGDVSYSSVSNGSVQK